MPLTLTTRTLSIGLLVAALCGGCGGSAVKGDGGVADGLTLTDVNSSSLLVGTVDASGAPVCITAPLMLVGGEAQCTVVQHLAGDGGVTNTTLQSCDVTGQGPCWVLVTSPTNCPGGGLSFAISLDPNAPTPDPKNLSYGYSCTLST
jgi:hypothetical protein